MKNIPGWGLKIAEAVSETPEYPWEIDHIYMLWGEYALALERNGMSPAMATWTGLRDWNEIMRHGLEPWELRAIARLSHARAVIESENK